MRQKQGEKTTQHKTKHTDHSFLLSLKNRSCIFTYRRHGTRHGDVLSHRKKKGHAYYYRVPSATTSTKQTDRQLLPSSLRSFASCHLGNIAPRPDTGGDGIFLNGDLEKALSAAAALSADLCWRTQRPPLPPSPPPPTPLPFLGNPRWRTGYPPELLVIVAEPSCPCPTGEGE